MMLASLALPAITASDLNSTVLSGQSLVDEKKWQEPLTQDQKILQLLNRAAFGPRPGDFERVRLTGLDGFLEEQLHPEGIDDSAIEAKVAALPTLSMTSEELAEDFQPLKPAGRFRTKPGPETPRARTEAMKAANPMPSVLEEPRQSMMQIEGPQRVIMELAQEEVLRAVYSHRQLQEVMVQFWMNHFNIFAPKGADRWLTTSFERDTIRPHALGKFEDLLRATAKSPAMLFYLDNWMSRSPKPYPQQHPNRPGWNGSRAGDARFPRPGYGPFGIGRRSVWGRRPYSPRGPVAGRRLPGNPNKKNNPPGLNENYGRELMELHTLGVEGGYTQKDVIEVARCLTGWTIDRPQRGGGFVFKPEMHDFGSKVVLGHKIRGGHGIEDGLEVLKLLALHPSTAHFISLKLCRRFVADDPPESLVERASRSFLKTDGDIGAVLKTILTSPEFYSQAAYRSKVKSPLELVASSLRALDGQTDAGVPLLRMIARMGQPMFQYQAPAGFPDRASTWINPGSLLIRINFATLLPANRIPGTRVDSNEVAATPGKGSREAALEEIARRLLGQPLTPETREAILKGAADESPPGGDSRTDADAIPALVALVLASPEFQRR